MTAQFKLIIIEWWVFIAYWAASARGTKSAAERQSRASLAAHRIPTVLGGILLFWHRRIVSLHELTAWIGVSVCFLGVICAFWARRTLGRNWSSKVEFKKDHELIESGPYRFVRHPIYTGILIMDIGTALCVGDLAAWLGVVCMTGGFYIKLCMEEAIMTRHFPAEYPAYKQRVKALIPFIF